jgi:hypothetical protein
MLQVISVSDMQLKWWFIKEYDNNILWHEGMEIKLTSVGMKNRDMNDSWTLVNGDDKVCYIRKGGIYQCEVKLIILYKYGLIYISY